MSTSPPSRLRIVDRAGIVHRRMVNSCGYLGAGLTVSRLVRNTRWEWSLLVGRASLCGCWTAAVAAPLGGHCSPRGDLTHPRCDQLQPRTSTPFTLSLIH